MLIFAPVCKKCVSLTPLSSEVYSCSVDGTVIAWNISTLKVNRRFQLPYETVTSIQFYKNRLWCCEFPARLPGGFEVRVARALPPGVT